MKKIAASLALCALLAGCSTPPAKKEGLALGFQRVKTDDPAFLKSDLGGRSKPITTDASAINAPVAVRPSAGSTAAAPTSPVVVGATTGAIVGGAYTATSIGTTVITGIAAAPVLAVAAVGAGIAATTASLASALAPDTDCGDGWALFTMKTAEGEIRTIRQPRSFVCGYRSGDVVRYLEDETGILVLK